MRAGALPPPPPTVQCLLFDNQARMFYIPRACHDLVATFGVVTGMAGTGIRLALNRYREWTGRNEFGEPMVLSLENDFLLPKSRAHVLLQRPSLEADDVSMFEILRLPQPLLMTLWSEAFEDAYRSVTTSLDEGKDVLLTFHAVWFHLGTRQYVSGVDFGRLSSLPTKPSIFINLIDDIFDMKSRLSEPDGLFSYEVAKSDAYVDATLKLLRILDWRSIENVMSMKAADACDSQHFVIAVKHHASVFHRLFTDGNAKIIYIAHPITEVRRFEQEGREAEATEVVSRIQELSARLEDT